MCCYTSKLHFTLIFSDSLYRIDVRYLLTYPAYIIKVFRDKDTISGENGSNLVQNVTEFILKTYLQS